MSRKGLWLSVSLLGLLIAAGLLAMTSKSASGQEISWTRQFGTTGDDTAEDMAMDAAGNLYVVGGTGGPLPGQTHMGNGTPI